MAEVGRDSPLRFGSSVGRSSVWPLAVSFLCLASPPLLSSLVLQFALCLCTSSFVRRSVDSVGWTVGRALLYYSIMMMISFHDFYSTTQQRGAFRSRRFEGSVFFSAVVVFSAKSSGKKRDFCDDLRLVVLISIIDWLLLSAFFFAVSLLLCTSSPSLPLSFRRELLACNLCATFNSCRFFN